MARKKKIITEEIEDTEQPHDDLNPSEIAQLERMNQDAEALDNLRDRFTGKQYFLRVSRLNEDTGRVELITRVLLDHFDPFDIGKKYGGGQYRGQLFDERGKFVKDGQIHFDMAPQINKEPEKPASALEDPVVQIMLNSQKEQTTMLMEMMKTVFAGNANQGKDLPQLIEALKNIQAMNPRDKEAGFEKTFELFLKFQDAFGGGGKTEEGGSLLGDLKEALKLLPQLKQLPGAPPPGVPRRVMVPVANNLKLPNPPINKESSMPNEIAESVLFYVPRFDRAASEYAGFINNGQMTEADENVKRWADFLLNVLETETLPLVLKKYRLFIKDADQAWDMLVGWSSDVEKLEKIYEHAPSLTAHANWVAAVIQEAVKQLDDQDEATVPMNGHAPVENEG